MLSRFLGNDTFGHQDADSHAQFEPGPLFFQAGGCQVDRDSFWGKREADIFQGRTNSVPAFLDGCIRQADDGKLRKAATDIDFDLDQMGVQSKQPGTKDFSKHGGLWGKVEQNVERTAIIVVGFAGFQLSGLFQRA